MHENQVANQKKWRLKNVEKHAEMNRRYVKKAFEKKRYYDYERMARIFRKMKL